MPVGLCRYKLFQFKTTAQDYPFIADIGFVGCIDRASSHNIRFLAMGGDRHSNSKLHNVVFSCFTDELDYSFEQLDDQLQSWFWTIFISNTIFYHIVNIACHF